jgi:hypothetical protein
MKKREKQSIIVGFILAILIFTISLLFIVLYLYPNYKVIEENKNIFS